MIRSTLLALTATAGLIGSTEFTSNKAQAQTVIRIGIGSKGSGVIMGGSNSSGWYRPAPAPIYYSPPPVVYYAPPPVIVTPVYPSYTVYFRDYPTAPWQAYGTYASPSRAQEALDALRYRGFEVMETVR